MRKVNAIVMNYDEFEKLVGEVSNGHAGIGFESNEWFFTSDDEYNAEEDTNKDLSNYLGVNVKAVRIDTTANEDDVVIICE